MRVALLDQMEIEVDVNENDVVNVALGDTALISVDAYPERDFRGVVTEIANSARVSGLGSQEQVTNFPVKIRILDPHNTSEGDSGPGGPVQEGEVALVAGGPIPQFRPGMSGTVDISTETVEDVVAVPIQAVTVRDFNQVSPSDEEEGEEEAETEDMATAFGNDEDLRKVIFIVEEGNAEMLEVETGIADDTHIEVKSGLEADRQVIIGPYSAVSRTLRPGMAVQEREEGRGGPRGTAS